jgi:hypothetical protein
MPWDWTDGIKIGSVIATVSAGIAVQANKIKALFKKTDRHQETLFGKDKGGGIVSDVNVIKNNIVELNKKHDTQQSDITWIRNHLANNKK